MVSVKKTSLLLFVMVLMTAGLCFGDTVPDENAAKGLADKIMAKAGAGDTSGAFEMIKSYAAISAVEMDGIIIQSKRSMDQFRPRYGAPTGFEFIDSRKAGNSLLRLRYIQKNTKYPLVWVFDFYKVKNGWILDGFNWNDTPFTELFR